MFDYAILFLSPWWLLLGLLLPVLWWTSLRTLSGLSRARRWAAIVFRTVVMLAIIAALAEIQLKRTSDRLTVIYLLDQSMSIPEPQRRAMVDYVNREIREHRDDDREDRAGVIVFGRDAAIEHPPYDDDIAISSAIESRIETDFTNLAGAIKLAQAALPEDSAGRIVVICDGNENLGDAREQARRIAEAGVGIDVVPVRYQPRGEVAVEKVAIPSDVNRGQPFDLRVVLNNTAKAGERNSAPIKGKLKVVRKTRDSEQVLQEENIAVEPGKKVYTLREEIDSPDFYTYEAVFTPDDRSQDALVQNNSGTAFTNVRGRGQVLLIEDQDNLGQFAVLVNHLRQQNLQVTDALHRRAHRLAGRIAAVRHGDSGQRPARGFHRRPDQHAGEQHAEHGRRSDHDRRREQFRRRRLVQHRDGTGHAGRFPDQERQGRRPWVRWRWSCTPAKCRKEISGKPKSRKPPLKRSATRTIAA